MPLLNLVFFQIYQYRFKSSGVHNASIFLLKKPDRQALQVALAEQGVVMFIIYPAIEIVPAFTVQCSKPDPAVPVFHHREDLIIWQAV